MGKVKRNSIFDPQKIFMKPHMDIFPNLSLCFDFGLSFFLFSSPVKWLSSRFRHENFRRIV